METTQTDRWDIAPSTAQDRQPESEAAWVYLLRCPDGSLYGGWTNDLARRLKAHNGGRAGAKYTKMKGQGKARLVYAERCADKSAALKREYAVKHLPKEQKEHLAAAWQADHACTVRYAVPADAEAVTELYNWYVTHSTASFQYALSTVEEFRTQIAEVEEKAPFLVAATPAGRLLGYACAHPLYGKEGYRWDVETTIYCAQDAIGQGVGGRLYSALLELLRRQGYREVMALVADPNPGSDAFHRAFGFHRAGSLPHIAYKFGTWLGLTYWRLSFYPLTEDAPPSPLRLRLPLQEQQEVLNRANKTEP